MAIKASNQISITDVSDGNGIASTSITYQAGSSGTVPPTGNWSSSPPKTSVSAPYMWTRTIITYTNKIFVYLLLIFIFNFTINHLILLVKSLLSL